MRAWTTRSLLTLERRGPTATVKTASTQCVVIRTSSYITLNFIPHTISPFQACNLAIAPSETAHIAPRDHQACLVPPGVDLQDSHHHGPPSICTPGQLRQGK